LLLIVKIAKDLIPHCNVVGRWWRRRRRRNHDRIYNNQMVALVNGSGTKIMQNKKVWSLVNVDDFGGWRRNCNDQESHGIKKLGMNGMDYVVSLVDRIKSKTIHE
jgi:hypothetical protein